MDIADLLPESPSDFGAILFWIIILILVLAVLFLYWNHRRMSQKVSRMQETLDAHRDQMNKSKEERLQKLQDVKKTVDKMVDDESKKL
jgi:F0F1-type ATP synthase membrane subunit a